MLLFCDGGGQIEGTPYDDAINATFKQHQSELGKAGQTFIVVLRSQLGQFIGFTINSSAVGVNFPGFPPLPVPPQPLTPVKPNPPPSPPPAPAIKIAPLVIIGTNVSTNLIPLAPPKVVLTNPPPTKVESNPPPAVKSMVLPTNAAPPKIAGTHTNTPAPPENHTGLSRKGALAIGAALLVAAVVVILFALFRTRKTDRGSLITRSMRKK